ncbi:hypothetical protein K378_02318 [Streptomyces sp. Amel2xB2]|uniref:hypothetical protein n=1 Tax=Streptomyces sp. Amel2xB2 TaxID=1305829 RepID=UPI000DBABA70|nr:hypothetical protein [Streptomyces sp. Amel2xB2]RAJ66953.1 hypothetical protein K378_02318 [Streptomyces sp. Amel2xB2]
MTAENDGTGATPQGDDPFGYLYRQEGGEGSPATQSGVPRRSYNQVRAVGERQYGGYGGYGSGPGTQQTAAYGQQPNAHYAAPETMTGGRAVTPQPAPGDGGYGGGHGGGRGGGGSRNGLLIGALAVVAAVVVGIGAAIYFNSSPGDDEGRAGASAGAEGGKGQEEKPGSQKPRKGKQIGKKQDAATFQLAGGASAQSDVSGAQSSDGSYVGAMNATGASATWSSADVPKAGIYTLYVRYGIPGKDADATLTVNGRPASQPLDMSNWGGQVKEGDWEHGWMSTYAWVDLKEGANTFKISCEDGNKCDFNLDQVWLKAGKLR